MVDIIKNKKYINTAVSIFFPRAINIRQKVFDFENALKDKYSIPPLMTPIPDAIDPEIPRFTFSSKQGHSQINVSQNNLSLVVNYDGEYSANYDKCEEYLLQRLKLVHPILEKVTDGGLCYAGLVNKIQYLSDEKNEQEYLKILAERFLSKGNYNDKIHDLSMKYTIRNNGTNFINLTISNVRNFSLPFPITTMPIRLPTKTSQSIGIQVILDVNDRQAYNENEGYKTDLNNMVSLFSISKEIITKKLDEILTSGKIPL